MSVEQARKAIEAFFTAFNNRDNEGIAKSQHYPHFRIGSVQKKPNIVSSAEEMKIPFDRLTEIEGWNRSTLDSVEVIHASEDKVHFAIEFSRYNDKDEKYATHRSLWIATKDDDGWGILVRSSFAP